MLPRWTASGILVFLYVQNVYAMDLQKDSYEQKGQLEKISQVLLFRPRIVVGNRETLGKLLDDRAASHKNVSKAVYLSSLEAFNKKGYQLIGADDLDKGSSLISDVSKMDLLWEQVIKFTDEGKYRKRKMLPYKIDNPGRVLTCSLDDIDAVIFVQIFGAFDYNISPENELAGTLAANAIVSAVTVPLIGIAAVGGHAGEYQQFDYKISVFDIKTGELIWYREGVKDRTDFRSWSVLMKSLEEIYDDQLPKASNQVIVSKFKKKRSEIKIGGKESS